MNIYICLIVTKNKVIKLYFHVRSLQITSIKVYIPWSRIVFSLVGTCWKQLYHSKYFTSIELENVALGNNFKNCKGLFHRIFWNVAKFCDIARKISMMKVNRFHFTKKEIFIEIFFSDLKIFGTTNLWNASICLFCKENEMVVGNRLLTYETKYSRVD